MNLIKKLADVELLTLVRGSRFPLIPLPVRLLRLLNCILFIILRKILLPRNLWKGDLRLTKSAKNLLVVIA